MLATIQFFGLSLPLSLVGLFASSVLAAPAPNEPDTSLVARTESRLDKIKGMYAWEGFVYALDNCPSVSQMEADFNKMKSSGARTLITFDYCGDGTDAGYYEDVITAAGNTGMNIIPLAWTLVNPGQTWEGVSVPKIKAVTQAVIAKPDPVLAVALGDEPLYDWDAGTPQALAQAILEMKSNFSAAGLSDIPVSISDMAIGWQEEGDTSSVADAVDFFMINNFPYFADDAQSGGSSTSWSDFTSSISYFESISQGKPLLVTQTGWPSNEDLWAPNSPNVVASVSSEEAFWNLLNSHCSDYFKAKNIAWMWRSYDDTLDGWGVYTTSGSKKWNFSAKTTC